MKRFLTFLSCLLIFSATSSIAQSPPIKWGKIAKEDLQMTSYAKDTSADAVVLADYGTISFELNDRGAFYRFYHHKRVKILKSSAFDMANIEIPYYASSNLTKVTGLKVQVYSPDGEKTSLGKKEIFDEEISKNIRAKKFACPKIEEGSIFEYKYQLMSSNLFDLRDWYFQGSHPIRHSELRVTMPEWFDYLTLFQGQDALSVRDEKFESRNFSGYNVSAKIGRYVVEDAPALRAEAYITTMNDYRTRIQFQLRSTKFPKDIERPFLSSWEKVAEEILEDEFIGQQFSKRRNFRKLMEATKPLLEGIEDPAEKVTILYNYIANNVEWDGDYSLYARKKIDKAYENRKASGSELNYMLLALLKVNGIKAYPLLLSTRAHGRMITTYPILDQFNHAIVLAVIGEKEMLMDVGDAYRPIGYPRVSSLNQAAWLVDKRKPQWVNINAPSATESFLGVLELDEEGNLKGEVKCSHAGYSAVSERNAMETDEKDKVWQKRLGGDLADISITEVECANPKEAVKPLKSSFKCSIPEAAQTNGDFIYFSPILNTFVDENPLKLEKRAFPVNIPYPLKNNYVLNLNLPQGYTVDEIPEPVNLVLPNKGGKFTYIVSQNGDKVQVVSKISLKQLVFLPEEYETIKKFFDLIIEKQSEQLILKKEI